MNFVRKEKDMKYLKAQLSKGTTDAPLNRSPRYPTESGDASNRHSP